MNVNVAPAPGPASTATGFVYPDPPEIMIIDRPDQNHKGRNQDEKLPDRHESHAGNQEVPKTIVGIVIGQTVASLPGAAREEIGCVGCCLPVAWISKKMPGTGIDNDVAKADFSVMRTRKKG